MTRSERESYITAVKIASTDQRFKNDYESLLEEHRTLFETGQFRIHYNGVGFCDSYLSYYGICGRKLKIIKCYLLRNTYQPK